MSKMLANALRENATVKELSLRANQMRGAGAMALFEALQVNCSLRSLDLTCNPELTKMSLLYGSSHQFYPGGPGRNDHCKYFSSNVECG